MASRLIGERLRGVKERQCKKEAAERCRVGRQSAIGLDVDWFSALVAYWCRYWHHVKGCMGVVLGMESI